MKMAAFISMLASVIAVNNMSGSEIEKCNFSNDTGYIVRIDETNIKPKENVLLELSTKKSVTVYTASFGSCFILNGRVLPLKSSGRPILLSVLVQARKDQAFQINENEIYKHR